MCIAIYSPIGTEVPCEDYLRNSFLRNDDGAGFAYNTDHNNVKIEKGFMTFEDFYKAFQKANKKYNFKKRGVLIHFRITTHGGTNKECCHPFPLVSDIGTMHKTKCVCDYAVIHNGIIDLTSAEAYRRDKASDTMVFIEKYLSKIATNKKWFKNKTNFELIYDMIDSKMAILNGYGEIKSTNGFVKDDDGNYYSNTTYKEARVKYSYSPCYWNSMYDTSDVNTYGSSNIATTSKFSSNVALMKLKDSEIAIDEETGDVIENEYPYHTYLDEYGCIFMGEENAGQVTALLYMGYGLACQSPTDYSIVKFRRDILVNEDIYNDAVQDSYCSSYNNYDQYDCDDDYDYDVLQYHKYASETNKNS